MAHKTLAVSGMSCSGCEDNVTDALEQLDGVSAAEADHERDEVTVTLEGDVSDEELADTVSAAGYEVTD